LACGDIDTWIVLYKDGQKHKALVHLLDCADSYRAPSDDISLLPVIKDAHMRDHASIDGKEVTAVKYGMQVRARPGPSYFSSQDLTSSLLGILPTDFTSPSTTTAGVPNTP